MSQATDCTPAIFVLQTERDAVTPNTKVSAYEEKMGVEFGLAPEEVHLRTAGTTTPNADSAEDN